jgi:nitrous oxide reductase accessory protein NosL
LYPLAVLAALILIPMTLTPNPALAGDAQKDIQAHKACPYCGMDRAQWNFSRMLIVYNDGTEVGTCALRCTAVDLVNNIDKFPEKISVADYNTKELLDAENAVWVIGGDQQGVMTKRAKWAFADQVGAEAFIKEHGGDLANFDQVIEAAYDDIHQDTKLIRDRRKAKREKMKMEKTQ